MRCVSSTHLDDAVPASPAASPTRGELADAAHLDDTLEQLSIFALTTARYCPASTASRSRSTRGCPVPAVRDRTESHGYNATPTGSTKLGTSRPFGYLIVGCPAALLFAFFANFACSRLR